MELFCLVVALLLAGTRPLESWLPLPQGLGRWADWVEKTCNAGAYGHGICAWSVAVAGPVLLVMLLQSLLAATLPLLEPVLIVALLYAGLGFATTRRVFAEIQLALRLGETERARQRLAEWLGRPAPERDAEVARLAISTALKAMHRQLLAPLVAYLLLPGAAGVVLYRLAERVQAHWQRTTTQENTVFSEFSRRVFGIIDWLPLRATAAAFAVVGNFEDAVYCWRTRSVSGLNQDEDLILASAAGALGVPLGGVAMEGGKAAERVGSIGDDAEAMQSAAGLVQRAVLLWLLLLFLLGLASLVG
ncbi:MAG: hypothetical protein RIR00_30 [Pseudomonadota bacterium]